MSTRQFRSQGLLIYACSWSAAPRFESAATLAAVATLVGCFAFMIMSIGVMMLRMRGALFAPWAAVGIFAAPGIIFLVSVFLAMSTRRSARRSDRWFRFAE